jgi:hypothetical protein
LSSYQLGGPRLGSTDGRPPHLRKLRWQICYAGVNGEMQWLQTRDAGAGVWITVSCGWRAAKRVRGPLAVPGAKVADGDSDDLRRPVWTQRRVVRRELAHHVLSAEAGVHQTTHIQALVQCHLATAVVSEAGRTDICQERTPTAPRTRARCPALGASRCRSGAASRVGPQSHGRQDGDANHPYPSRATAGPP